MSDVNSRAPVVVVCRFEKNGSHKSANLSFFNIFERRGGVIRKATKTVFPSLLLFIRHFIKTYMKRLIILSYDCSQFLLKL